MKYKITRDGTSALDTNPKDEPMPQSWIRDMIFLDGALSAIINERIKNFAMELDARIIQSD